MNENVQMRVAAEWISLRCRRCGHILLFHKYYHLNISEQWNVVSTITTCIYRAPLQLEANLLYIYSNGQKNCCAVSRGRLIKYPLSFIHIIYNMACVGRFWSRWCSVCVCKKVGGKCVCVSLRAYASDECPKDCKCV